MPLCCRTRSRVAYATWSALGIALITLIGTLGKIYGFDTETIVLTIAAVATFLGAITGISNINYYKDKEK